MSATKSMVEKVLAELPSDFKDKLVFEEIDKFLTVKPKAFLGAENFQLLRTVMDANKGEYVSAGKFTHFRIYVGLGVNVGPESLKEWYQEQKDKDLPLSAYVTVNLNFNISTAEEVEKVINEVKKHVRQA